MVLESPGKVLEFSWTIGVRTLFHALGLQEAGVTKSLQVTDFRTNFKNQVVFEFTSCIFPTRF